MKNLYLLPMVPRSVAEYVRYNQQNSPLSCQNSAQTKVMPGEKVVEQCRGMQAMVALEACADGDTLDQTLEYAWLRPPSFALPASPLSFSLLLQTILWRGRGRGGLAGGNRDNKGFKTSELPTAKPLSRQREARQPLPSQAFQPHQP